METYQPLYDALSADANQKEAATTLSEKHNALLSAEQAKDGTKATEARKAYTDYVKGLKLSGELDTKREALEKDLTSTIQQDLATTKADIKTPETVAVPKQKSWFSSMFGGFSLFDTTGIMSWFDLGEKTVANTPTQATSAVASGLSYIDESVSNIATGIENFFSGDWFGGKDIPPNQNTPPPVVA